MSRGLIRAVAYFCREVERDEKHPMKFNNAQAEIRREALSALMEKAERLVPITRAELMLMEGKPIYVVYKNQPERNGWKIVAWTGEKFVDTNSERLMLWRNGIAWIAYRREPGGYCCQ